jgi:hypothetical protein
MELKPQVFLEFFLAVAIVALCVMMLSRDENSSTATGFFRSASKLFDRSRAEVVEEARATTAFWGSENKCNGGSPSSTSGVFTGKCSFLQGQTTCCTSDPDEQLSSAIDTLCPQHCAQLYYSLYCRAICIPLANTHYNEDSGRIVLCQQDVNKMIQACSPCNRFNDTDAFINAGFSIAPCTSTQSKSHAVDARHAVVQDDATCSLFALEATCRSQPDCAVTTDGLCRARPVPSDDFFSENQTLDTCAINTDSNTCLGQVGCNWQGGCFGPGNCNLQLNVANCVNASSSCQWNGTCFRQTADVFTSGFCLNTAVTVNPPIGEPVNVTASECFPIIASFNPSPIQPPSNITFGLMVSSATITNINQNLTVIFSFNVTSTTLLDAAVFFAGPVFGPFGSISRRQGVDNITKIGQDLWHVESNFTFTYTDASGVYIPYAYAENARGDILQRFPVNFTLIENIVTDVNTELPPINAACDATTELYTGTTQSINNNCTNSILGEVNDGVVIVAVTVDISGNSTQVNGAQMNISNLTVSVSFLTLTEQATITITVELTISQPLELGGDGELTITNGASANVTAEITATIVVSISNNSVASFSDSANFLGTFSLTDGATVDLTEADSELNLFSNSNLDDSTIEGPGTLNVFQGTIVSGNTTITVLIIIKAQAAPGRVNPVTPTSFFQCCGQTCGGGPGVVVGSGGQLTIPACNAACTTCATVNGVPNVATRINGGTLTFQAGATLNYASATSNVVATGGMIATGPFYVNGVAATATNNRRITVTCQQAGGDCGCALINADFAINGGFVCTQNANVLTIRDQVGPPSGPPSATPPSATPAPITPPSPSASTVPPPPSFRAPPTPAQSPTAIGEDDDDGLNGGEIAGIVIGSVAGFIIIMVIIGGVIYYFFVRRRPAEPYYADPYEGQPVPVATPGFGFAPPNTPYDYGFAPYAAAYDPYPTFVPFDKP